MKTKSNLFVILSLVAIGGLQGQTAPAAAPASSAAAPAATAAAPAMAPLVVDIVVNDMMSFSVTKIEAKPGQIVTIKLKNTGTLPKEAMAHNWILLKGGVDMNAYAAAAANAKAENFQPKALADQVYASIPMIGAKQTGEVTFTCPTTPGTYKYLCSCYGHALTGMKGTLVVK